MELMFHQNITFWTGFIAGLFILLHLPSCDVHWANKLGKFSGFLSKHHYFTLRLATFFAIIHVFLDLIGLVFGVWI